MIGTGKYDFPGIRKSGAALVKAALATTAWGKWLVLSPFSKATDVLIEWFVEYLTNQGLIILNIGAIVVEGKIDQMAFDQAMDDALEKIKIPGLTDEQKKAIDQQVIDAFRKFGTIARVSNLPNKRL